MLNSIGEFVFRQLKGQVVPPAEQPERVERKGVSGTSLWLTGQRGVPFTLRSLRDVADLYAGRQLFASYLAKIGGDPVALTQDDYDFTGDNWKVEVLGVRLVSLRRTILIVGGLDPSSGAILEADWQLNAVPGPSRWTDFAG